MLAEGGGSVNRVRMRSGGCLGGAAASDQVRHLKTCIGAPRIPHREERFGETDPGFGAVDVGLESALEALQRAEPITAVSAREALEGPFECALRSAGPGSKRVEPERHRLPGSGPQHRNPPLALRASVGAVMKSCTSFVGRGKTAQQPVSPSSLLEGEKGKGTGLKGR